jgi:hypothetical protein
VVWTTLQCKTNVRSAFTQLLRYFLSVC